MNPVDVVVLVGSSEDNSECESSCSSGAKSLYSDVIIVQGSKDGVGGLTFKLRGIGLNAEAEGGYESILFCFNYKYTLIKGNTVQRCSFQLLLSPILSFFAKLFNVCKAIVNSFLVRPRRYGPYY